MYRLLIFFVFFLFNFHFYQCITCDTLSTCKCKFTNGSIIDLSSLDNHIRPRFKNERAVDKPDNCTYAYNLCYGFRNLGGCNSINDNVAVCQYNEFSNEYHNLGDADSANFLITNNVLNIVYSAGKSMKTTVDLVCDINAIEPKFVVHGEESKDHYLMTLTSRCACPDLCGGGLSTGSVLVILFMIFVILYLVLGIIHSSLTRGASGWELIPHYEFWSDFPLLVRDGCVFVVSGCIGRDTSYGSI